MSCAADAPTQARLVYARLTGPLLDPEDADTAAILAAVTAMHERAHDLALAERKSFVLFWLHLTELDHLHRDGLTAAGPDPVLEVGDRVTDSTWCFLLHQATLLAREAHAEFFERATLTPEPAALDGAVLPGLRETLWLLHLFNTQARRHPTLWTFRSEETRDKRHVFMLNYFVVRAAAAFVHAEASYLATWAPGATADGLRATSDRLLCCLKLVRRLEDAECALAPLARLREMVELRLLVVHLRGVRSAELLREGLGALEAAHRWLPSADTRRGWGWPADAARPAGVAPRWDSDGAADAFLKGRGDRDESEALRAWPFKLRPEAEAETRRLQGGERDGTRLLLSALRLK